MEGLATRGPLAETPETSSLDANRLNGTSWIIHCRSPHVRDIWRGSVHGNPGVYPVNETLEETP